MDSGVLSALISGGLALIGTFGGILTSSRLTSYRIEKLEQSFKEEINKHTSLEGRVSDLEAHNAVQDEKIRVNTNSILELKEYHKQH